MLSEMGGLAVALVGTVLAGVVMVWSLVGLWHARDHQARISRTYRLMRSVTGVGPVAFGRMIIPLHLMIISLCLFGSATVAMANAGDDLDWFPLDLQLAVALSLLGAVVLSGLTTLMVPRFGRPKFLVLEPWRHLSVTQIERWLDPDQQITGPTAYR